MATNILSLAPRIESAYRLPEKHRQAILAKADNPAGKISQINLKIIEQKRIAFIQKNKNQFGD